MSDFALAVCSEMVFTDLPIVERTFPLLAIVAFFVYQKAQDNFSLALLTKAEQLLVEERPAQTFVLADGALGSPWLPRWASRPFRSAEHAEQEVRSRSIARIAGSSVTLPLKSFFVASEIGGISLSPDGSHLAVGSADGDIVLMDLGPEGQSKRFRGGSRGYLTGVKFTDDGKWLAASSYDRSVRLWNVESGEAKLMCGHRGNVNAVALDPQKRYLASASSDGRIVVWSAATLRPVREFQTPAGGKQSGPWGTAVEFSHDGALLAAGDESGGLLIARTGDWSSRWIPTGQHGLISLSFSADDRHVAVASISGTLKIWDARSGSVVASLGDYQDKLWRVRFSPDGRLLAAASWGRAVRFWDGRSYQYAGTIDVSDHGMRDIAFSKDSRMVATAALTGVLRLWNIEQLRPMFHTVRDNERETLTGRYSPDGSRFVTGARDRLARVYNVDERGKMALACSVEHEDWVRSVAFSPDGALVASTGTYGGRADNVLRIWRASDCRVERTVSAGPAVVLRIAYRPDGKQIAWATRGGELWVQDLEGAAGPRMLGRRAATIYGLAYSPDSRLLITAGQGRNAEKAVAAWNLQTGAVTELYGEREVFFTVAFSPDGRFLAAGADKGTQSEIVIWQLPALDAPARRLYIRGGASAGMHFSAEGNLLAVGSDARSLSIWSVPEFEKVFQLGALIGARGIFGIRPKSGDIAFDGENGLVRVLPSARPPTRVASAELHGTDVLFDRMQESLARPSQAKLVESPAACPAL